MSDVFNASAPGGHLYQSGFPSWLANLPASVQAHIANVMTFANPIQPAAADTLDPAPNPLNNPTPVDPRLAGGGPPVPPAMLSNAAQPPAPMPPGAPTPVMGPPQSPTPWFTGSNTPYAPNPAVGAPMPPVSPESMGRVGQSVRLNPQATATATAPATGDAAPGSSPFIKLDYRPNADPGIRGGMLGGALAGPRGQGGAPVATALDLSHLFGGGGQAAAVAPAALPKTKIKVGKIPASATASVPYPPPRPKDTSIARARILRPDLYG